MSHSGKSKDNLNFYVHYRAAEKNQEKSWELLRKVTAICTGFSARRRVLFWRENKNSNVDRGPFKYYVIMF